MFAELITPEQLTILGQIIFIDLVLAGDNAIIIGMVASKFPVEQRKKIIFWGIGGAFILVPAMIYIIKMPTKLVPGTSLFVTIFVSVVVTFLHSFNYGSIDLLLVLMLVLGLLMK